MRADIVIINGGGGIADVFKEWACNVLDLLGMANQLGIPTAIVSQGLGPIQDAALKAQAERVLPSVGVIAIRERRTGPLLLGSLRVPMDRVITTGDDAVELAYEARVAGVGAGIGVNLRIASYSGADKRHAARIRPVLHDAAKKYDSPLIPLPTSFGGGESDVRTLGYLLNRYYDTSDSRHELEDPRRIIEQVKHCRVVITGSYHPAVFALSQGIPVVCLSKSPYYLDKFLGLAEQFAIGCKVILLDDEQLQEKLKTGIREAWESSEEVRPQLLKAARQQIDLGYVAYQRIYELMAARKVCAVP